MSEQVSGDAVAVWKRFYSRLQPLIDHAIGTAVVAESPIGSAVVVTSSDPDNPARRTAPVAFGVAPLLVGDTVLTIRIGGRETVVQIVTRP